MDKIRSVNRFRGITFCLFLLTLLVAVVPTVQSQAADLPLNFTEELITDDLESPTNMAFAPDGRLFVLEQGGRVRIVQNDELLSQPFMTLSVNSYSERGLIGLTFDPNFSSNGYIYFYRTVDNPTIHNRISRFTANGNTADSGSEVILLDLETVTGTFHNSGEMHFGRDGMLYVAVGDDDVWPGTPNHPSQRLNTAFGKIIRITRNGDIPTDNPFYSQATGLGRATWALGVRSPVNFAFRPNSDCIYVNDVGEDTWEEVNEACEGDNLGWPDTEGYHSNPNFVQPLYVYPHGFGGTTNDGCAVTGGTFYTGNQFPPQYRGDYFFADYCNEWIQHYDPNNDSVTPFATGIYNATVDLAVSGDGSLYYLSRGTQPNDGRLVKISFALSQPPTIVQNPADLIVVRGDPAQFSCAASGYPPLAYRWQRNRVDIPSANQATYNIAAADVADDGAKFRCVVTNPYGSTPSQEANFTVINDTRPVAVISKPQNSSFYTGGQTVTFAGNATDIEDGLLPASAYTWWIDFHHNDHTHPFMQPKTGVKTGTFIVPVDPHDAGTVWYRIHQRVTDSAGLSSETYHDIFPQLSRVTLLTNPPGLGVKIDGQYFDAPEVFEGVVGETRSVEAVTPQIMNGIQWTFNSWSDGGRISHLFKVPSTDRTLTVNYRVLNNASKDRTPTFFWNQVAGTSAYQIQIDDDVRFGSPNQQSTVNGSTTYTASSLDDGAYYWRVQATTPNPSQWVVGDRFIIDNIPPQAPTLLLPAAGENSPTQRPGFRWQSIPDAVRYELRLEANDTTPDDLILLGKVTQYLPPSPLLATTYYWNIRAVDAAGNASNWSETYTVSIQTPGRSVPVVTGFTSIPQTLRWTEISWAVGYEVQVDNNSNFSSPEFSNLAVSADSPFVSVNLGDGIWYWRVRAKRADGRLANWSQAQAIVVNVP
jgi:glucose/arabinose dehydrogenase